MPASKEPSTFDPSTNGMAIASLVFGLVGGIFVAPVLGIVALRQIRRRGQQGRNLAIAGIALSGVWALVLAVWVAAAIANTPGVGDTVTADRLGPGSCVNGIALGTGGELTVVACEASHEGEVIASVELPDGAFPGEAEVARLAETSCQDALASYAPGFADKASLELHYTSPGAVLWSVGGRQVTCVVTHRSRMLTGSIRG